MVRDAPARVSETGDDNFFQKTQSTALARTPSSSQLTRSSSRWATLTGIVLQRNSSLS